MKKLTRADILGPKLYAGFRDELRRKVIELKRARRIAVGPHVTMVFENRATMIFQIEEMCRVEGIEEPSRIQEEIDVYNRVLPEEGGLAATLLVEITEPDRIADTLHGLVGLHEHVWLSLGGLRIQATFDAAQFTADRLAAVQYIKFALDARAQASLRTPETTVRIAIDHRAYRHEMSLEETSRASLALDLD